MSHSNRIAKNVVTLGISLLVAVGSVAAGTHATHSDTAGKKITSVTTVAAKKITGASLGAKITKKITGASLG